MLRARVGWRLQGWLFLAELGLEDLTMSLEGGLEEFEGFFDSFVICSESRAT